MSACLPAFISAWRNNSNDPGDITSVVVSLGGKTADVGETMLTDGTTNIINAMKAKVGRVASMHARFVRGSRAEVDVDLCFRSCHRPAVLTHGAGIADAGCMQGVKRIAVVTSIGAGDSENQVMFCR